MKLISTINSAVGFSAKTYYNPEFSEYVTKYYENGKVLPEITWNYTDDKDDAINTAHHEIKFMADNSVLSD